MFHSILQALPSSSASAGANSTSVTVSSLSGPSSSQQSDRLSCCSSIGTNPGATSSSTGNNNPQDLKSNHLSRGSPHSKSLKHPSSLSTPEAKHQQPQRVMCVHSRLSHSLLAKMRTGSRTEVDGVQRGRTHGCCGALTPRGFALEATCPCK